MLRFTPIENARHAESYYAKSDGGCYLQADDLHREWGGKGAALLGLSGVPDYEQFKRLIHGLDPHTGEQLTAKLIDDRIRIPGWDVTASVPKGVTTALERGDLRIRQALWDAGREAMADLEEMATTRVRKGGKQEDRVTGNLVWFATEHPETRPAKDDGMPDWDRHLHFVVFNLTRDEVEGEIKAVKFRPIMDLRQWFSMRFDLRLASKLTDLGYEIETKYRADFAGGKKYYSWDVKGIPASVIAHFSRRTKEVEAAEEQTLAALKEKIEKKNRKEGTNESIPEVLSIKARDKLGATSRQHKRDDLTLADYRDYWNSRISPEEGRQIAETIKRALTRQNPSPANTVEQAVRYAIEHQFERNSVVRYTDLAITAMRRCLGAALPEAIEPECRRQGVLLKDGQATTRTVLEQEQRILTSARQGRGAMRPLGDPTRQHGVDLEDLSADQRAAVLHVWQSPDQVVLIRGGAGTGKTTMMKKAIAGIDRPVIVLAPSADASRSELRAQGFADATTVAAFLDSSPMQQRTKGGVIWVDEAGLLSALELDRLCEKAHQLGTKLVLQGDPKQHKAVPRHGNMLTVLHEYAGLPVSELKTIQRQKGRYAEAVEAIREGEWKAADGILRDLGWILPDQGHAALVAEYARALKERKAVKVDGKVEMAPKSILVIDPTHKDGDQLSAALRTLRKAEGLIDKEDKTFTRLVPLNWTNAEKGDAERYAGAEVVQLFRNSGPFKAGDRVEAAELLPQLKRVKPEHFQVYEEQPIQLARGDIIRITAGGRCKDGHRLDNGRIDQIADFTASGEPVLANGWVLEQGFGHWKHGLVSTSHAAQSKTHDIVLAAMNRASLGALSAEQGYVTVSRGRERGMIFSDLSREELLQAMKKQDLRQSATELLGPRPAQNNRTLRDRTRAWMQRVRVGYRRLRQRMEEAIREVAQQRELSHAGFSR
jgi:conjugative relaxase-like TrwC/TraI family protein